MTKLSGKTAATTIYTLVGIAIVGFLVESAVIVNMFLVDKTISYTYFISYAVQVLLTEMVIMIAAGVDLNLSISKAGATLTGDMEEDKANTEKPSQ